MKHFFKLLAVFFLVVFVESSHAQNIGSGKSHQLLFSLNKQSLIDDQIGLRSGEINSKSFSWSYSDNTKRKFKSITIGLDHGDQNNLRTTGYLIEFKNSFSIFRNQRLNNYLGYTLGTSSQFIKLDGKNSWISSNAVSLFNSLKYSARNSLLLFDISMHVSGLTSRPDTEKEYKGSVSGMLYNSLSKPVFSSFHNYQAIDLSLHYTQYVSNSFAFTAGVSFSDQDVQIKSEFKKKEFKLKTGISYFLK